MVPQGTVTGHGPLGDPPSRPTRRVDPSGLVPDAMPTRRASAGSDPESCCQHDPKGQKISTSGGTGLPPASKRHTGGAGTWVKGPLASLGSGVSLQT